LECGKLDRVIHISIAHCENHFLGKIKQRKLVLTLEFTMAFINLKIASKSLVSLNVNPP